MTVLFTKEEIQQIVEKVAQKIHSNHLQDSTPPVFICVLNGAFMFFTDLIKQVNLDCEVDFVRAKSYSGTTQGEIIITKTIETNISGKNVYLIDDIYDTGNTIKSLIQHLESYTPKSITPVTLFKKHYSKHPDLIFGFELTSENWLIGYGLDDENGLQRNLQYIKGFIPED